MGTVPEIAFLKSGSREWGRAWENLAYKTGDMDLKAEHPNCFEIWQYMCSFRDDHGWIHEFRHRCHPKTNSRRYEKFTASPGWTPAHEKE